MFFSIVVFDKLNKIILYRSVALLLVNTLKTDNNGRNFNIFEKGTNFAINK
jgi:hypothetical protein